MKLDKNLDILIVGLGLMGGSYAMGLHNLGYKISAIDNNQESIDFALEHDYIDAGSAFVDPELIGKADLVVFALYPHVFKEWIAENQGLFKSGAIITDVTGVKASVVYDVNNILREDVEYIAAHPMAGREVYGVQNATDKMFADSNYIIVPADHNTVEAIETCKAIGQTLGFARISALPPRAHDEMIGFVSQLTHCIAITLMTCNKSEHLVDYTGDSFRDLTRIANINENMWTELFMMNQKELLRQMDIFANEFELFRNLLANGDEEGMKEKMRISTERRKLFNKKKED